MDALQKHLTDLDTLRLRETLSIIRFIFINVTLTQATDFKFDEDLQSLFSCSSILHFTGIETVSFKSEQIKFN